MAYTPGPFNGPHLYVQWGGGLPGGDEWSCGFRMAPRAGHPEAAWTQAVQDGVAAAIRKFFIAPATGIHNRAGLTYVKVNKIGVDGKYVENVTHETVINNPGGGQSGGYCPPNQVALAVSLTTGVSRGPAHRGRFYLPLPAFVPGTDGLIAATDRDGVKASALTLVNDINAVSQDLMMVVMSRKVGNPGSRQVSDIQVGRVLDTQRRRRNKLAESYT